MDNGNETIKYLTECDDLIKEILSSKQPGEHVDESQIAKARKIVKYACDNIQLTADQSRLKEITLKNAPFSIKMPKGYTMNEVENNPPNTSGKFTFEAKDSNGKDVIIKKYKISTEDRMTRDSMIKLLYGLREIVITTYDKSSIICKSVERWVTYQDKKAPQSLTYQDLYQVQEKYGNTNLDSFFKYQFDEKKAVKGYKDYKFTKTYIRQLFHDLIKGMVESHELGVCHRNITGKNIIADSISDKNKLRVKITNFDKSRKLDLKNGGVGQSTNQSTNLNRTATLLAEDDCAPELYFCNIQRDCPTVMDDIKEKFSYTKQVDIYSLGAIFWRILTTKNCITYLGLDTLGVLEPEGPIDIRVRVSLFSFFGKLSENQKQVIEKVGGNLGWEDQPNKGYFKAKQYDTSDSSKSVLEHILRERCEKSRHLDIINFPDKEYFGVGPNLRKDISNTWLSDAIDLTIKMLNLQPKERPSARDALAQLIN